MPIKLGMVMDSIDHINIKKDTSFAMLLEAQARGWELHYMELNDLFLRNGRAYARTRTIKVQRDEKNWYEFTAEQDIPLDELDVIMMRKDPPFDQEYIYATYLLERAESMGVYVINKPQSLRDANEKLFTAWFPQCCAETLVAREPARIRRLFAGAGRNHFKTAGRHGRHLYFPFAPGRSQSQRDSGNHDPVQQPLCDGAKIPAANCRRR